MPSTRHINSVKSPFTAITFHFEKGHLMLWHQWGIESNTVLSKATYCTLRGTINISQIQNKDYFGSLSSVTFMKNKNRGDSEKGFTCFPFFSVFQREIFPHWKNGELVIYISLLSRYFIDVLFTFLTNLSNIINLYSVFFVLPSFWHECFSSLQK